MYDSWLCLFGYRHIFLGFTKCGRYVLSYTSDCGEDDDFSFYTYHLYWWEFNLHSRLKQVKETMCSHLNIIKQIHRWSSRGLIRHDTVSHSIYSFVSCLPCLFRSIMYVCLQERKSTVTCTSLCVSGQMTTPKLLSLASSKDTNHIDQQSYGAEVGMMLL